MKRITRRDFMRSSIAAGTALAMPFSHVRGANDNIRIAVIGLGGADSGKKGQQHVRMFNKLDGVRVVALCDVDSEHLEPEIKSFKERNENITAYTDARRILDNKFVDAIVIATPNHWHSLLTVWGCQSGKDVYVEKPISHNIWEGRKMVEAARKYKRIVQAGTQTRSDNGLKNAFEYIQQGNLGKILLVRGICYKRRASIGKVDSPQPIPQSVDYNLWAGPAPLVPLMRKRLHYDWHWVWATGCGSIGNVGLHQMDVCRWALGQNKLPPRAMSIGGRFGYDDDGETANTQIAILDYEPAPILFEVRGLPKKKADSAMDPWEAMNNYKGLRQGIVIHCEGGYFAGGWAYDNDGKKVKQFFRDGGGGHQANFIKAIRSRKVSDLNADILEGHLSTTLSHMANVSYRIGTESSSEQIKEVIGGNKDTLEAFERLQNHLLANEVDLKKTPVVLGPWLKMDSEKEKFIGEFADRANELLKRKYRKPFVVPEQI
ncbi:MAG: Gfo/Idh/MocA family protein [Planctomycetota bacterium]|jgi:predicted dehydrogenase